MSRKGRSRDLASMANVLTGSSAGAQQTPSEFLRREESGAEQAVSGRSGARRTEKPDEVRAEQTRIPLSDIVWYHREDIFSQVVFHDYGGERLAALSENIEQNGIIEPIIVFRSLEQEGRYEVLAGKQRTRAQRLLAKRFPSDERWQTIPARVLDAGEVSRDEYAFGDLVYVDTNIQRRDDLKPSELGMAYEMQFNALAHHGVSGEILSNERIAEMNNTKSSRVELLRRVIPKYCIPELLQMADENRLSVSMISRDLSRIGHQNQRLLYQAALSRSKGDETAARRLFKRSITSGVARELHSVIRAEDYRELTQEEIARIFEYGTVRPPMDSAPVEVRGFNAPSAEVLKSMIPEEQWGRAEEFLREAVSAYISQNKDK